MALREAREEVAVYVESDLALVRGRPSLERVGVAYDELCKHYRILAGCALLLDGDVDEYADMLTRSGHARVHLLERLSENPAMRNPYLAAGNADALFDALAAGNFGLARIIASLSPTQWWKGEEYEEDFHFAHFFHLLIRDRTRFDAELDMAVDQLAQATDDDEAARPRLCKALRESDQTGFSDAFARLLEERDLELAEDKQKFWPDGKIGLRIKSELFTEALALLNVADQVGLRTEREYPYCPALARQPSGRSFASTPI